jgi:hypothetical protein
MYCDGSQLTQHKATYSNGSCFGQTSANSKILEIVECKAYVWKEKTGRTKQRSATSLAAYDTSDTIGWEIYFSAPDTFVATVHYVLFDEKPHKRSDDYFCELDEAASVFTGIEAKSMLDFEHLIGSHHINDEDSLLYVT